MRRDERVGRIARQVRAGTYLISSAQIADAILRRARRDAELTPAEWREFQENEP